jgi:putative cell wall-binding protein
MKWILVILSLFTLFLTVFFIFFNDDKKLTLQGEMVQNELDSHREKNELETDSGSTNPEFEVFDMVQFSSPPSEFNQNANNNIRTLNTKNITRIDTNDPIETAIYVSQTIFPATHKENQPGTVILAPLENWQAGLASGSLVHHAYNGPILFYTKDGIPNSTMDEINRLSPLGNRNGTQIMVMGEVNDQIRSSLSGFKVDSIIANNPAEFAEKVDEHYSVTAGGGAPTYSQGVIIVSSDESSKLYSLPAINWSAHKEEPVLFISKDDVPEETIKSLQKRENPNIYVLGPERIISNQVIKELNNYGKVTRIGGLNPITNAIKFAQFKDEDSGFGWGLKEPGHGLSFVSTKTPELAIPAAPFSHLGKHAPLIWLDKGEISRDVLIFLASIKPSFIDDPSKGPFNHGYLIGSEKIVTYTTQGILDEKLEIVQADGEAHSGH